MTFEEAIIKMIKAYWDDLDDYKNSASNKDRKYTKPYFDGLKERIVNPEKTKQKDKSKATGFAMKEKEKY